VFFCSTRSAASATSRDSRTSISSGIGGQRHAHLVFDRPAVGHGNVLGDVGLGGGHDAGGVRVLPHELHDLGVLHRRRMDFDVGFVVLVEERPDRLAREDRHVLGDRVHRLLLFRGRDDLADVLQPEDAQHLPVQLRHVVHLRRLGGELQRRLVLHHPLRHRRGVRVGDRQHVDPAVIILGAGGAGLIDLILVLR
jgi:hypothetical protein